MAKTEVYSWRVETELKMALESEARHDGLTVSQVLHRLAEDWLRQRTDRGREEEAEQQRVYAAGAKYFGSIAAGPDFSQNVGAKLRRLMKERNASKRSA